MKQDYREYHFTGKEIVKYLIQSILLCGALDYLFYQNKWLMILAIPVSVIFLKVRKKQLIRERRKNLNYQFKDALNALSVAVQAGYSVENAFKESYRDIYMLYGENSIMAQELYLLTRRLRNNEQLEDILMSLGNRSGVKDIRDFAEVFRIAKRNGGSLSGIISNTAHIIEGKSEVRREINTIMSEKKMEQKIMQIMPFGMMLYVSLTSPGFFEGLYHNLRGVLLMSVCLIVYAAAYVLGDKILKIEV